MSILENSLNKMARYDEGSLFSSILSLTVSVSLFAQVRTRDKQQPSRTCRVTASSVFILKGAPTHELTDMYR